MSEEMNIPDNGSTPLTEDKLMAYLDGTLPHADRHAVEEWLAHEGMEGDALEGLRSLRASESKESVSRLQHALSRKLNKKTRRKRRTQPNTQAWVPVLLILLLVLAGYIVLHFVLKR